MKLILSRKGFDSAAGGVPSPIFPDGRMLSLPIPDNIKSGTKYVDIFYNGKSLGPLIEQLASKVKSHAHLDPDLVKESLQSREDGWHPIFGQSGAAQGHLHNNDISTGDLFLFLACSRISKSGKVSIQGLPNQSRAMLSGDGCRSMKSYIWESINLMDINGQNIIPTSVVMNRIMWFTLQNHNWK